MAMEASVLPPSTASTSAGVTETIDTSGGREFWEAWVDSKSDAPAGEGVRTEDRVGGWSRPDAAHDSLKPR